MRWSTAWAVVFASRSIDVQHSMKASCQPADEVPKNETGKRKWMACSGVRCRPVLWFTSNTVSIRTLCYFSIAFFNEKKKAEPSPYSLSTHIFPPCASINFLLILRPRPVPSFLVSGMRKYRSKILSRYWDWIPCPVSVTEKIMLSSSTWRHFCWALNDPYFFF